MENAVKALFLVLPCSAVESWTPSDNVIFVALRIRGALNRGAGRVTIQRSANVFTGRVPTIRVNLSMDGRSSHSETWIVFDFGHTLPPNSELLQGKLMHWGRAR